MRVIRWLFLWFPVILIWTNALIFEQNTTTFLKVNQDGFTVKICGNGSQPSKFCYGGLATDKQKQNCSSNSYCGIQALKNLNALFGHYGGENAIFEKECMEISVKPSEQIALNSKAGNPEKGTCRWNVTEDGKLPIDITVTTGFDVRVEGAELYPEVGNAGSGVSIWVYVGEGVGAVIACCIIGGIIYCGCRYKKKVQKLENDKKYGKLETEKKDEKENVHNVVTTPKPVGSKFSEVNVVGQSRETTIKSVAELEEILISRSLVVVKPSTAPAPKQEVDKKKEAKPSLWSRITNSFGRRKKQEEGVGTAREGEAKARTPLIENGPVELKEEGTQASETKKKLKIGTTAKEEKMSGTIAKEERMIGTIAKEAKMSGTTAKEERMIGTTAKEAKMSGTTAKEGKMGGTTAKEGKMGGTIANEEKMREEKRWICLRYEPCCVYEVDKTKNSAKSILETTFSQPQWWFNKGMITKDEMNTMSENYLFQNRHACSKKEWKMYFGPVEQGAEIARELRKLAEEYYGGMDKIYEDELGFAEKVRIAVRDGCTPGYVWAWSFVQQHKELFNVRVEDVIKEWDINGLALLLFSNITDEESAAILREIKVRACDLINMHGERSDQTSLYPIPLFHLINQKYGNECHIFPTEVPDMHIPPAPMMEERPTITLVDDDQRVAFPPEQPLKPGQKTMPGMDTISQTIVESGSSTGGTTTVEKPSIV